MTNINFNPLPENKVNLNPTTFPYSTGPDGLKLINVKPGDSIFVSTHEFSKHILHNNQTYVVSDFQFQNKITLAGNNINSQNVKIISDAATVVRFETPSGKQIDTFKIDKPKEEEKTLFQKIIDFPVTPTGGRGKIGVTWKGSFR